MKLLLILVVISASFNAIASADGIFTPVAICGGDSRALVVDKQDSILDNGRGETKIRTLYQLVLKNKDVVHYFQSQGAIGPSEVNNKGEFIIDLTPEYYSTTEFYGTAADRTITLKFLSDSQIAIATYSAPNDGSRLLANFIFNDCYLIK